MVVMPDVGEGQDASPCQESLQVPQRTHRRMKSPTPVRFDRSLTPIRGRSVTPLSLYMSRRSATPAVCRSITPYLQRDVRAKSPLELGDSIQSQLVCNKAVFDRALVMDISESEEIQKPVRYLTTDTSVIDRASVMDVSNVEYIYIVEEYEDSEYGEEYEEEGVTDDDYSLDKQYSRRIRRSSRSASREQRTSQSELEDGIESDVKEATDIIKKKEKAVLRDDGTEGESFDSTSQPAAIAKPPIKKSKPTKVKSIEEGSDTLPAEEEADLEISQQKLNEDDNELVNLDNAEGSRQVDEDLAGDYCDVSAEKDRELNDDENIFEEAEQDEEEEEEESTEYESDEYTTDTSSSSEGFTRPDPEEEERWQRIADEEGEDFVRQLRNYRLAVRQSLKYPAAENEGTFKREHFLKPHFIVYLSDRTVEMGQTVRLTCAVGGEDLTINWFKDGRPIKNDAHHRLTDDNNILTLELLKTTTTDSGEYKCIIANKREEVISSCIVTIYEKFTDIPLAPTIKLVKEYFHMRDDELTIEVHVDGVPRPIVSWWHKGFEIVPNFKYTILEEAHGVHKLLIYKPTEKDYGIYLCRATNFTGKAQIRHEVDMTKALSYHTPGIFHAKSRLRREKEMLARKAIAEAMKSKEESDRQRAEDDDRKFYRSKSSTAPLVSIKHKLSFVTQLHDRVAAEGTSVKFMCNVMGPNPTYRWMKNNKWVVYDDKVQNLSEEGKPVLLLRRVTLDTSGVYKCIVRNDYCEIETSCYLKVYAQQPEGDLSAPIFALPLRDIYHMAQNDLIIDTKVRGNPRPKITWFKDKMPIQFDERIAPVEHVNGLCELIINKPTQADNGLYTCKAQNIAGIQETTHMVVMEVPHSRRSSSQSAIMSDSESSIIKERKSSTEFDKTRKLSKWEGLSEVLGKLNKSRLVNILPKPCLRFSNALENCYIAEKSAVKFATIVSGSNTKIKWLKDDQEVIYGPLISNTGTENLASLEFLEVTTSDSGVYTAVAENEFCRISTSATLVVYPLNSKSDIQPLFVQPMKDNYNVKENCLVLESQVRGQPNPSIQWFKYEDEVIANSRIHISEVDANGLCQLVIQNPNNQDSGLYTIKAENNVGKAEVTHYVCFKLPEEPKVVEQPFEEIIASETANADIPIETELNTGEQSVEDIETADVVAEAEADMTLDVIEPENADLSSDDIKHLTNNNDIQSPISEASIPTETQQIPTNNESNAQSDANVVIEDNAEVKNEGDAEQVQEAANGTAESKTLPKSPELAATSLANIITAFDSLEPDFIPSNEMQIIHFTSILRNRCVTEDSVVRLYCFVVGREPQIIWYKDGNILESDTRRTIVSHKGLSILEISNVSLEDDGGEYKCYARDETGESSTSAKLEITSSFNCPDAIPFFNQNIKDVYYKKVSELQLECQVQGTPTPLISWMKEGVILPIIGRYQQIEQADGKCVLIITNPDADDDNGLYACHAENRVGEVEINYQLQMEALKPKAPARIKDTRPPTKPQVSQPEVEPEVVYEKGKRHVKGQKRKPQKIEPKPVERGREPVEPIDLKKRVYLLNFLSDRTVRAGFHVKWMITVAGPDPSCLWYHNDQLLAFSPKRKIFLQDSIATLRLIKVTEAEAGVYTLRVKGANNEVVTSCNLNVYTMSKKQLLAPIFTIGIKEIYQAAENRLCLECKVSGQPTPKVFWQKDNTALPADIRKYKYKQLTDGVQHLIIEDPHQLDTGVYTCYAENDSGQMKISKFVDVLDYMPKITEKHLELARQQTIATVEPDEKTKLNAIQEMKLKSKDAKFKLNMETSTKPMIIASGVKAQLICYVSGFIEDVYWLKGEERIFKDARHKIYNINGALSLEIYEARPDDSAEYKCVVRNSRYSVEWKCLLTVYDGSKPKVSTCFGQPITVSYNALRNELVLICNVLGRPCLTWLKDDHTICNNRYQMLEDLGGIRKLAIRNPISSDCGTFSCFAETNDYIECLAAVIKTSDLKYLLITANDKPLQNGDIHAKEITDESSRLAVQQNYSERSSLAKRKPLFACLLQDRTSAEFSNICLSCNLIDDCGATVEWLRNGAPLPNDNRFHSLFRNGEAVLEIRSAQTQDSGQYTCSAVNDYGQSVTHAHVRIYKSHKDDQQSSVFVQSIKDSYSLHNNELVLECRVRGKPQPKIRWMKGREEIEPIGRYTQLDDDDGYAKLIIDKPTERDSGVYTCLAENEMGESSITHHVEFVGQERFSLEKSHGFYHRDPSKPHFLAPLGDHTVSNGGTIAITAEFLQTSSPLDVQWFHNRQPLINKSNIKTISDRGLYTLAIMDATAEHEGTYTCRAQNAFGGIESNAHIDITAISMERGEQPPLFLSRPETEMRIVLGDPFSISFRVSGDPKPKLIFMKGTKDITKMDRVSKEISGDYIRFTVQKSQIYDSGTYFVIARNSYGTDRIFVTIEVTPRARSETPSLPRCGQPLDNYPDVTYFKDPPAAISTEPMLVDAGPTHISLTWGKPPANNSAPVIAYRVDAWMIGHDGGAVWRELGLTPINSYDAFNLKTDMEYHFRVTPKNRYGWGPSVATSAPFQVCGVESLPEFTKILPGQVKALMGQPLVLECSIAGRPRPDVCWYKDGLRLGDLADIDRVKIRKIGSNCSLTIKSIIESDAGRYTCEATNSKGRMSTFVRLQVVSDPKLYEADHTLKQIVSSDRLTPTSDTLPIFTMRLRDRRVQVTYPVRLICQIVGYPQPHVSWYKDDELLKSDSRCQISVDHSFYALELLSTSLNDSGIYTCKAKNDLGSVSCHCSLVVDKGIRAYISPEFYVPLDPLYIFQEEQDIVLTAKVEAYPAVGVSWYQNGVKLRPSRRLKVTLDDNGFVELVITRATALDGGMYICVASNAVGKTESICRVCVERKDEHLSNDTRTDSIHIPQIRRDDLPYSKVPLFVVKPRSSEAFEGDTVIIFCEVVGDPKPEVVWLRDFLKPEYYKDAPHFRRIGDGPEYRLEIPYAKLQFTGTYSVIASNCHGEAKAVISLQIYAKDILKQQIIEKGVIRHGNVETLPRFIRHLRNLRCCDGDAVTLEAHVEGLPDPTIIWEKDGRILLGGKDYQMTYDGIKATLSIPRIYPEDEGEYTCVAKNNLGRTLCSACIIVDVPEEKDNLLQKQLCRPPALRSTFSTPLSTPRSTPIRGFSPTRRFAQRHSLGDIRRSATPYRSFTDNRLISAPKFLAIPYNRVVEEGDSVRFHCAISGHPTPWSTWDKDGVIVVPTARVIVKEVDDLRSLEIDAVGFEDAGLYRITLENDYGRIEATARLDVIASSSRRSKSPFGRNVRASSSRHRSYLYRRIMGPSTAIGGRMALASGYRGSSVPSCKFYTDGCNEITETTPTLNDSFVDCDALHILKAPLSCIANKGGSATFYARVYPFDAPTRWFVCSHQINDSDASEKYRLYSNNENGERFLHIKDITKENSGKILLIIYHPIKTYTLESICELIVLSALENFDSKRKSEMILPTLAQKLKKKNSNKKKMAVLEAENEFHGKFLDLMNFTSSLENTRTSVMTVKYYGVLDIFVRGIPAEDDNKLCKLDDVMFTDEEKTESHLNRKVLMHLQPENVVFNGQIKMFDFDVRPFCLDPKLLADVSFLYTGNVNF